MKNKFAIIGIIIVLLIPAFAVNVSAAIGKPQKLAVKGDCEQVDDMVDTISTIIAKTDISKKLVEGIKEIYVDSKGNARVVKIQIDSSDDCSEYNKELNKHFKKYGYNSYDLDIYYDNPTANCEPVCEGPICISGYIGDDVFTYYFADNMLIRRIANNSESDNPKTNDFLASLFRISWEFQNIDNSKRPVTEIKQSNSKTAISTDSTLENCIGKDYKYISKKYGRDKTYAEEMKNQKIYPFWYVTATYDDKIFVITTYDDKCDCIYTYASEVWDIPYKGIEVYEFLERAGADILYTYEEECKGDLYIGDLGDIIAAVKIDNTMYEIVVKDGIILPESCMLILGKVDVG